nr:WRKY [Loropetalum chinense var. rubrum]
MEARFNNTNPFVSEPEENQYSPENCQDSPPSSTFNDGTKMASMSSPKRRRAMQKRVVSVPIKDVEGSRLKGHESAPPSDSWAWRKYGQKPIKGSPYPRGYYRCSSSKGCPARKQVERSRVDPTMLVVTYSCDHNHPWPASRNNHSAAAPTTPPSSAAAAVTPGPTSIPDRVPVLPDPDEKFADLGEESMITTDEFSWFADMESMSSTILESPIFAESSLGDADVAMFFPMREEDESLFADLGELPECSVVFRRGVLEREEERRRCTAPPWCGTTS